MTYRKVGPQFTIVLIIVLVIAAIIQISKAMGWVG